MWSFLKRETEGNKKTVDNETESSVTENIADVARKKDFENLKLNVLKEFDKRIDSLVSEHKIWSEQYQRNMKNMADSYDRRIGEFDTKVNIARESLEKGIDDRKDLIGSLNNVLDFDKVVKYKTSGIIDLPNDLGDLRNLGDGNWEIIILVKRVK